MVEVRVSSGRSEDVKWEEWGCEVEGVSVKWEE